MNHQHHEDIKMGDLNEILIKEILETNYIINDLEKTTPHHPLDYYSKSRNTYYEIKSRRNKYNQYPTTMIGKNKIDYANTIPENVRFIFSFTDGNYFYQYNKNDKFELAKGGRNDRGKPEYKQYYYIPINKLNKII